MAPGEAPVPPWEIPALEPETVLELMDRWKATVPARGYLEIPAHPGEHALVFGDTHSDWPTVEMLAQESLATGGKQGFLIGLGDYVDRAPPELRNGSAINAIYLFALQLAYPERAVFLRGNHETQRELPILRPEVDDEARKLWGTSSGIAERIEDAFDRWPLVATTSSGAFLAHGGVPRRWGPEKSWKQVVAEGGTRLLEEVAWNDLEGSRYAGGRGLDIPAMTEEEVVDFLDRNGLAVFLRGHDPTEAGKSRFQNRVLTLHTSRVYDWAGMHVAEVPLEGRLRDLRDVRLRSIEPPPIPTLKAGGRHAAQPK